MLHHKSIIHKFYYTYINRFKNPSYSQEGEDRILARIFEAKQNGFYIDIGAHHPFRFSNTYLFYLKGWHGINIEANPDAVPLFKKFRPLDTNLNIAIGTANNQSLEYFKFQEPALNSFDAELSKNRISLGWKLKEKIKLPIQSLGTVLDNYLPKDQKIDFMSIDVEGLDLDVLKSNFWEKYQPDFILIECLNSEILDENEIYSTLTKVWGYRFFAKTVNTFFFKKINNEKV